MAKGQRKTNIDFALHAPPHATTCMKNRMLTLMLCDTADSVKVRARDLPWVRVDGRFTDHASVATPFSRTAFWMSDGNDGKQTIKADSGVP